MPNSKKGFIPFENESDSLCIGDDLTIENRLDRISIYGSLELSMDKQGLKYAYELKSIIDASIEVLQHKDLPERIVITEVEIVDNPFL